MSVLIDSPLPNRTYRGKVRDTYDLGERMLIVATDRLSAFDAILPTGIPDQGKVLSQMSAWWFQRTSQVVPKRRLMVTRPRVSSAAVNLSRSYPTCASPQGPFGRRCPSMTESQMNAPRAGSSLRTITGTVQRASR